MYSLFILGNQIETLLGKVKFFVIFMVSGICGGLLSAVLNDVASVGASGAIFGLMGAMLCFGYHYRTYLGDALKRQILPVIILNLVIGFMSTGIDNFAHIGGLIGGIFCTMALGVENKSKGLERFNGILCLLIYIGVLSFMLFFR
jgi:rhomboid protease GluP